MLDRLDINPHRPASSSARAARRRRTTSGCGLRRSRTPEPPSRAGSASPPRSARRGSTGDASASVSTKTLFASSAAPRGEQGRRAEPGGARAPGSRCGTATTSVAEQQRRRAATKPSTPSSATRADVGAVRRDRRDELELPGPDADRMRLGELDPAALGAEALGVVASGCARAPRRTTTSRSATTVAAAAPSTATSVSSRAPARRVPPRRSGSTASITTTRHAEVQPRGARVGDGDPEHQDAERQQLQRAADRAAGAARAARAAEDRHRHEERAVDVGVLEQALGAVAEAVRAARSSPGTPT